MQDINVSLTAVVFLALIALLVAAVAIPVEIVDTFQNANAVPFRGTIMVIQEMPNLSSARYEAEGVCRFRFRSDWVGPLLTHPLVPDSLPVFSDPTMPEDGETQLGNTDPGEPGATFVLELRDELGGSPVPDNGATLPADPVGLANDDRDSW